MIFLGLPDTGSEQGVWVDEDELNNKHINDPIINDNLMRILDDYGMFLDVLSKFLPESNEQINNYH